jgi:hypothetical protein
MALSGNGALHDCREAGKRMPPHGVPALAGEPVGDACGSPASFAHPTTLGRVTEIDNQGSSGMPRAVLEQEFDAVGNRTSLSAEINGTADFADSFEFDLLSRMTRVRQTRQTGGNVVADKRREIQRGQASLMEKSPGPFESESVSLPL